MTALRLMLFGVTTALAACATRPLSQPIATASQIRVEAVASRATEPIDMTPTMPIELDERALSAAMPKHDEIYVRALMNIERNALGIAAGDLESAAEVVTDALGAYSGNPPRVVRFDREMARRLREVADSGSGKLLVDRIAAFDTRDERERKLIYATAKLAQSKLLHDYRTLPDAEAALAARVFFKTVWIMQIYHPPVCKEMLRRFPFELAGGGHYEPPPFYRDGDPRVI
jgi:hypothetical protein